MELQQGCMNKRGRGSTKATWGQDGLPFESFRFFSPGLREMLADQFELDAVCFMSNQVRWNIRIFGCSQKFCLWWNVVLASSIGHELWFLCLQSPSECHREVISQHQFKVRISFRLHEVHQHIKETDASRKGMKHKLLIAFQKAPKLVANFH